MAKTLGIVPNTWYPNEGTLYTPENQANQILIYCRQIVIGFVVI